MTRDEWDALKEGDVIQHENGDVEHIVEYMGALFIDGERTLFPLSEFDWREWTMVRG